MPEQQRDRRLGWCDLWARETPEGNPYAHPVSGLKLIVDMNTLELLEIEDHHDYGLPDGRWRVRPAGTGHPGAHRPQAAAHHPARGRLVHRRRQRAAVAELDDAARLQLPRGSGDLPGHLRRPGHRARRRLPDVVRRDGRALPGPGLRPLPAHRLRHRRVGARLHDHLAGAGLRLPRRDRLRRRRAARHQG